MYRELKYIIRRIIVGVGIALILFLIKSNVFAMQVSNYGIGASETVIDNLNTTYVKNILGNPWAIHSGTNGYIIGTFAIQKVDGTATSINVFPKQVYVNTNTDPTSYVCEVGSAMTGNSTFNGGTFTYKCPVKMGTSGITALVFEFQSVQTNFNSSYRLSIGSLMSYEIVENASVNVDTSSTTNAVNNQTQSIINNQNQNNQAIINNQNSNTQDIIDNQNANSQAEIESQKVCNNYDKNSISTDNNYLGNNGHMLSSISFGITNYLSISSSSEISFTRQNAVYYCYYNVNKTLISCSNNYSSVSIPSTASYVRFSIYKPENRPLVKICSSGNQAIANGQQEINNTLNNDNVEGASSEASSFFDDFQSDSHGLSGIVTAPLRLIESLSSSSCSSLVLPLPFVSQNVTLPCMSTVYNQFPTFYSLWQLITTGMIAYFILVNLFGKVHDLQNPNNDRIEVLNL